MTEEQARQLTELLDSMNARLLAQQAAIQLLFANDFELQTKGYVRLTEIGERAIALPVSDAMIERVKEHFHALIDPKVATAVQQYAANAKKN